MDETEVERDYSIRKKIKAIFNKSPGDFNTLTEFKDYEEEVEDIIYKLANQIDVEETNRKVEAYRQMFQASITQNQHKKSEEIRSELSSIAADAEEKRRKFEKLQVLPLFDVIDVVICFPVGATGRTSIQKGTKEAVEPANVRGMYV